MMKAKYVLAIFALATMLAVSAQERTKIIRPGTDRERKMRLRDFIERLMQVS